MADEQQSPRSIERIGFDRFVFERAIDLRRDGATSQQGVDSSGSVVVGAVTWPEMPTNWLVLSSRRDQNPLELDIEHDPIVDQKIADRFLVDSDDDDLSTLLTPGLRSWLLETDDSIGPIHLILDGAGDHLNGAPTIFLARTISAPIDPAAEALRKIDMADLATSALHLLRGGKHPTTTTSAKMRP